MTRQRAEILIVDDEAAILDFCRRGMDGEEFHVATASSGEEAVKILSQKRFDILLADIQMAPPGGLQLADLVRKRHGGTDVIIITGYPSIDTAVKALKLGAYDYLIKPIDLVLLKAAVRRCLERRGLRQRLAHLAGALADCAGHIQALTERLRGLRRDAAPDAFHLELDGCRAAAETALRGLEELRQEAAPAAAEPRKGTGPASPAR